MQTVTIDTHEAIEALRAKKFTKEQAKGIVDTIWPSENEAVIDGKVGGRLYLSVGNKRKNCRQ